MTKTILTVFSETWCRSCLVYSYSGVFRIWQKGGHGERRARTYNGGLGRSPLRAPGQSPWSGGQEGEAP